MTILACLTIIAFIRLLPKIYLFLFKIIDFPIISQNFLKKLSIIAIILVLNLMIIGYKMKIS